MEIIKKVNLKVDSLISLIESYKGKADFTRHELSKSSPEYLNDISDKEVMEIIQKIEKKEPVIEFTISPIDWEEYGNCEGDELYPVESKMTLLPDERYYVEIITIDGKNEYIY